jgi:hypothetical protein
VLAAAGAGCRREQAPQADATASRPTPEASFAAIAKIITDGIEISGSDRSQTGAEEIGARGRFAVYNTVASKLIPPATPSDPYRGTITVTSKSVYSLRRTAEDEDKKKKEEEEAAAEANRFSLLDEEDDSGFEVMDSDLVSASPEGSHDQKQAKPSVIRQADEDVRTYDLVYRDGRWVLVTELDPETEQSIKKAFDRALRVQP